MAHTITFDTLSFSKKMIKAGFTQQQAEAQAEALIEIIDDNLATKHDIELVKNDLKEVKKEIIIWLGGIVIIVGGIMTTVIGHLISLITLHH